MIYNPHTTEAFNLLMQGALALQRAESQGFCIDVEYCNRTIHRLEVKMKDLEEEFKETKFFRHWEHATSGKLNINSGLQLSNYLYNIKKLTPAKLTETGKGSVDEEALEQLNIPELNILARKNKLKKCKDVLTGYLTEQVGGVLHPSYNLHLVTTYRSSSNSPNMQNAPKRDEEAMRICRRAIIPRPGHQLIEVDMSGAEVKIAACYHKDETMLKYINDPSTDMHRDMARQIFLLDEFDKSKHGTLRQAAKNGFVFPQFYGDWYKNCAANLACNWGQLSKGKWKAGEGIQIGEQNLSDHLIEKGITSFSKFEDHIKDIEHDFWTNRFSEYNQWKDRWWGAYKKNGYFTMLTGFMCQGVLGKKEVTNYPVQGCLQGSSRILTDKGLIPIKDLVNKSVKVWTGYCWADAIGLNQGEYQLAEIELSSGIIIKCDTRHKLKNENNDWVSFGNLKIGDYVSLPRNIEPIQYSGKMNWPFIFGFIIGDGCLSSKKRNCVSITVGEKKKPILENIYQFLIEKGYVVGGYIGLHWGIIPPKDNKKEKYRLSLENKHFAEFLKTAGFHFGWKSYTKRVPDSVWYMSAQDQRDFMEGIWLSDGDRSITGKKRLNMAGKELLKDLQILSSSLGFDSVLVNGERLSFQWRGFNIKSTRKYPVNGILKQVNEVNSKNYMVCNEYIKDKAAFNLIKKNIPCSQYIGERIIEKNSTNSEIYRYDTIKNIRIFDKTERTYTMSVFDNLHQFVADGVITKNSAFHCLLKSFILVDEIMRKERWGSRLIGQVHDSMLLCVSPDELEYVNKTIEKVVSQTLPDMWKWIIVPLTTETEICGVDKSWAEKRKYESK